MNKKKKSTNISPYPDDVIDRLARAFYPAILACWNSEEGQRSLVGARPLHLACARPFGRLKAPLGLSLLRCAAQTRACRVAGGAGSSCPQQRETERSRRGTPCCTYRYCLWSLAGCVLFRDAPCFCFVQGCALTSYNPAQPSKCFHCTTTSATVLLWSAHFVDVTAVSHTFSPPPARTTR